MSQFEKVVIRISLLVMILVAAGLLWPQTGSYRDRAPGLGPAALNSEPPANRSLSSRLPASDAQAPPYPSRSPTGTPKRATTSVAPPAAQSIDWLAKLYPELARIAELESHPAYTALAELVPLLASEDPAIRLAAIESIGDMTRVAVLPPLIAALDDANPQVRVAALRGLALRGDIADKVGAIESALFDSDRDVRITAIETLAILESAESVYALASLLSDQDAAIRHHAVGALGEIGGERAKLFLQQARFDPHETIRIDAAYLLEEMSLEQAD